MILQGNEHVTYAYPDGRERYLINGVEQPRESREHDRDREYRRALPPNAPVQVAQSDRSMSSILPTFALAVVLPPQTHNTSQRPTRAQFGCFGHRNTMSRRRSNSS